MTRLFTLAALMTVTTACIGDADATEETAPALDDVLTECAASYSVDAGVAHAKDIGPYVDACEDMQAEPSEDGACDPHNWLTEPEALCVAEGLGFPVTSETSAQMQVALDDGVIGWAVRTPSTDHAGFVDELALSVYGDVLAWTSEQETTDGCRAVADCG